MNCPRPLELRWKKGDNRTPVLFRLLQNDLQPVISGLTAAVQLLADDGSVVQDFDSTGVTVEPTITVAVSANRLAKNSHGLRNGQQIALSGTVPTGVTAGVRYAVRDVRPNDFRLAAHPAGAALTIADAGSLTVVLSGCVSWLPASDLVAGTYRLWLRVGASAEDGGDSYGHSGVSFQVEN